MKLIERLIRPKSEERYDFDSWAYDMQQQLMHFQGYTYQGADMYGAGGERIENNFASYVAGGLKNNGIVWTCVLARMLLFSEIRFQWRRQSDRRLFGNPDLSLLENPGDGRSTGELLAAAEVDVSMAGNFYATRRSDPVAGERLVRMRPDWVEIMSAGEGLDSRVIAYAYTEGGPATGNDPKILDASDVAHYSPYPDPAAKHRGMSWLTPILTEIEADGGFTEHRKKFVENAAVIPYAVTYPDISEERFAQVVDAYRKTHEGTKNSWRSLHLAGGADVKPLGVDLRALDFKNVQGGGETRICSAARVPAVVAGISEALGGSSLNQGNYGMARRQFGDGFGHPHWRMICAALAKLVPVQPGAQLWYDASEVSFLREDHKDQAEVQSLNASAIRQLVDGGFEPDSVVSAVTSGDLTQLQKTGLVSVQLLPPGASTPDATTTN